MGTPLQDLPRADEVTPGQRVQIWMPSKHMGNLLLSLRAIEALVEHYSATRCTLVIDESYRQLMPATGIEAPVVYFPRKAIDASSLGGKLRQGIGFIGRTRLPRPLIAIAVEGDKVSQRFLPLSGCRFPAGPDNRYCRRYPIRLPLDHGQSHVFFDYEAVARQLTGTALTPGYPRLHAPAPVVGEVNALLHRELADPERPYAVLHPCATKDYKQWPVDAFARLAESLVERGFNVAVTGAGRFDGETIGELKAASACPLLYLHDRLNLSQFIALLAGARLYVGNDTGPTHLAAACGTATFALFGPTDESLWGPLGENARVVRNAIPCEPTCLRRNCSVGYRCIRTLPPATVLRTIESCL